MRGGEDVNGPRLVYNRDATSTVVAGDTIAWISAIKRMRRPAASKRYVMKRARRHAQVVNRAVHYFRKLGWRGEELCWAVVRCVEAYYEAWDPDDLLGAQ